MEKKRILVVDDEEMIREVVMDMITLCLTEINVSIMDAPDVESAQNIIKKCDVDLIISDINMPGKDGITFCKEMREVPEYSHIPFIFMSGNRSACQKAKKIGAVLEKPFDFNDLVRMAKELLILGKILA